MKPPRRSLFAAAATAAVASVAAAAPAQGPCDILAAAGNPCVAAHSTVRALFAQYAGPLYSLTRALDNSSADVSVLSPGGFANAAAHDAFCGAGVCVIAGVYDQTPLRNDLYQRHKLVNASQHRLTVGAGAGVPVYGMLFEPGYGYHRDNTTGVPTGNEPESIYAVVSGTHYNDDCCFDYGNSETDDKDDGPGAMEAIYFGNATWHGVNRGSGAGPWVGADLEAGMYYGGGNVTQYNPENTPLAFDFVTASLKGREDGFTLKGGDATGGPLALMYDGVRPNCGAYQPARKQGAIILATGGDSSNRARGTFYEGFMAVGYASDATDDAIQANIVGVQYRLG